MAFTRPATIDKKVWDAFIAFDASNLNGGDNLGDVLIQRVELFHAKDWVDAQLSYDFFNAAPAARVTNLDNGKPSPDTLYWLSAPSVYILDGMAAGAVNAFGGAPIFSGAMGVAADNDMNAVVDNINTEEMKRRFMEFGVLTATINKRTILPEAIGLTRYPRGHGWQFQSLASGLAGTAVAAKGWPYHIGVSNNGESNSNNVRPLVPMQPLMPDGSGLKANISVPSLTRPATAAATGGVHKLQIVVAFDAVSFSRNTQ